MEKNLRISDIIPYESYSFGSAEAYYDNYSKAALAITQKKGGWDCFRHVEIISSGCIPLFLDAHKIPRYTMIHYPKEFLAQVNKAYFLNNEIPGPELNFELTKFANSTLTCRAMCEYFMTIAEIEVEASDKILFIDSRLSLEPDYLSVLTYIGLKQIYGNRVESLFDEPDYVYRDTEVDLSSLYGRGFGYTKVLERIPAILNNFTEPKVVVVSNLERDILRVSKLYRQYPNSKFLFFWGSDNPVPDVVKKEILDIPNSVLFSREIY